MAFANEPRRGTLLTLPGWLVFVIFVPLQIWLFLNLFGHWRWWTVLFFLLLGLVGSHAARAPWLTSMLFPHRALRHERRRHVFQGILFLGAALAWLLPQNPTVFAFAASWPQPWLPLAFLVTLLKSALR